MKWQNLGMELNSHDLTASNLKPNSHSHPLHLGDELIIAQHLFSLNEGEEISSLSSSTGSRPPSAPWFVFPASLLQMERTRILRAPDRFLDLYSFSLTHVTLPFLVSLPLPHPLPWASIPGAAETFSWGAPVVALQLASFDPVLWLTWRKSTSVTNGLSRSCNSYRI